jgi:CheY-like chemotaxis protein
MQPCDDCHPGQWRSRCAAFVRNSADDEERRVLTESLVAGCRVLVADDSPFALELIKAILEKAGCEHLTGAGGGREALALAEATPFDIVLLDVTMPDMNGYEVTRALRATLPPPGPVIMMLTGRDIVEVDGEARAAGADGVMAKPVDRRKLLALLESLLQQRSEGGKR